LIHKVSQTNPLWKVNESGVIAKTTKTWYSSCTPHNV